MLTFYLSPPPWGGTVFWAQLSGAFTKICGNKLLFKRLFRQPPESPTGQRYPHYMKYSLIEHTDCVTEFSHDNRIVSWQDAQFEPICLATKPFNIWLAMKGASIQVHKHTIPNKYGLHLALETPPFKPPNLAGIIKLIIDGAVSAFHSHDGSDLEELVKRLGSDRSDSPHSVSNLLMDNSFAVLGPRRLLWKRAAGVQWNPADDNCVSCLFTRQDVQGRQQWKLSGELFAIE